MDVTSGVFGAADAEGSDEVACAGRTDGTGDGPTCADEGGVGGSGETNRTDADTSDKIAGADVRGCACR